MTELIADGKETLPDDDSCTDKLCQWSEPKGAHVNPKRLEEVKIGIKESRVDIRQYSTQIAPQLSKEENYQRVLKLVFDIRNSNRPSCMPAVVNLIDITKFSTQAPPIPSVQTDLPDKCTDFDLPVSFNEEVSSYALPVYKLPHKMFKSVNEKGFQTERNRFIKSVLYTEQDIQEIEKITKGQSSSQEWFEQRKGAITGSKVLKIVSYISKRVSNPHLIVKDIMQYDSNENKLSKIPAIAWGVKNEQRALLQYVKDLKDHHKCKDVELIRPGLLIHNQEPYIRVSPDALILCECHGRRLVEVKCPYSFRNKDLNDVIKQGKLEYVETINDVIQVKKAQSRGYYEQITLQQALCKEKKAELVIWSKVGYVVVPVEFDNDYWENTILPSLKTFFLDFIVPEILTERVKNGQKIYSDECIDKNQKLHSVEPVSTEANQQSDESDENDSNDTCSNSDSDDPSVRSDNLSETEGTSTGHSKMDVVESADSSSNTDELALADNSDGSEDEWVLGCKMYCKDERAPNFSKVKSQLIACDANLQCGPNTWYHLFCEGFRRVPSQLSGHYVCRKCRNVHPDKENLEINNGFYD